VILVRRLFLIFVLILSLTSTAAHAIMVLSMNLEQMTGLADRIFLGTVLSSDDAFDEDGRWCNFVVFSVTEAFKGDVTAGTELKIKQVSQKPMEGLDGSVFSSTLFLGVPQYKVGEEILVLLAGDSAIGFTSPVGLSQGAFRVVVNEIGDKMVVNDAGNKGLFKKMTVQSALKARGISEARFQALISNPKAFHLDQMRSFLKVLTESKTSKE
jgi:hypothetical protein